MIFLDDPHTGTRLGNFDVQVWDDNTLKNLNAKISGYPADRDRAQYQYFHERPIQNSTASTILYDVDTYGGQSGSPVWSDTEEDGIVAVGIHTTGSVAGNSATRITAPVMANLRYWLNAQGGDANRIERSSRLGRRRAQARRAWAGCASGTAACGEGPGVDTGGPQEGHRRCRQAPRDVDEDSGCARRARRIQIQVRSDHTKSSGGCGRGPEDGEDGEDSSDPPELDDVPTDVEVADPYQRLAALGGTESAGIERPRF